jgi:hypothetical protein
MRFLYEVRTMKKLFALGILALLLSGCNESDDSYAEGLWVGTTGDSRAVSGLVLRDGRYYFFFSTVANDNISEVVAFGNSETDHGDLTSKSGIDFSVPGPGALNPASITGTYRQKNEMNLVIRSSGSLGTINFSVAYDSEYEDVPTLGLIDGSYTGVMTTLGVTENVLLQIDAQGDITGTGQSSGCTITGSAVPISEGNAYSISLDTGGGCAAASLRGHAYFRKSDSRLLLFVSNSARDNGVFVDATK